MDKFSIFAQDPPGYTDAGVFHYFEDIDELEDTLCEIYECYGSLDDEEGQAVAFAIDKFCNSLREDTINPKLAEKVETILGSCCEILYFGKPEDTAFSMDPFSMEVRAEFRDMDEETPGASDPIRDNEIEDFMEFIIDYSRGEESN